MVNEIESKSKDKNSENTNNDPRIATSLREHGIELLGRFDVTGNRDDVGRPQLVHGRVDLIGTALGIRHRFSDDARVDTQELDLDFPFERQPSSLDDNLSIVPINSRFLA